MFLLTVSRLQSCNWTLGCYRTALHRAAARGNANEVVALLRFSPPSISAIRDHDGRTAADVYADRKLTCKLDVANLECLCSSLSWQVRRRLEISSLSLGKTNDALLCLKLPCRRKIPQLNQRRPLRMVRLSSFQVAVIVLTLHCRGMGPESSRTRVYRCRKAPKCWHPFVCFIALVVACSTFQPPPQMVKIHCS